ncbi:YfiT family bacillithiol transferase [Myroides marinus]|uniref:YfiT family bacillithiol transferase n=1 Tax=Myroides marinus TaxID=703342 RepID=UPI0025788CB4|nr:bacillithiol transferase BstA [Myroides marinus]MDM1348705.1 bacillithiol transferase BstA [Myroides marinus]
MTENIELLRYPIGEFVMPEVITDNQLAEWIKTIEEFPKQIKQEVEGLSNKDLEKRYRPGGWTIRQVVHHCADSHMNSLTRFKLALIEDQPIIKPYAEHLWAELTDSKLPIESSLAVLEGLHFRWAVLLRSLSNTELDRTFIHPANHEIVSLRVNIGIYAWHCNHHLNHIINAKQYNYYE